MVCVWGHIASGVFILDTGEEKEIDKKRMRFCFFIRFETEVNIYTIQVEIFGRRIVTVLPSPYLLSTLMPYSSPKLSLILALTL